MECNVCYETKNEKLFFTCNACKYINCTHCHKTYLLSSSQDPHCMNCRAIIPFDIFIDKFSSKWVFDKYKKHRYDILWNREQSLLSQTMNHIANEKEKKKLLLKKNLLMKELQLLNEQIYGLTNNKSTQQKQTFQYTYRCPMQDCKGFLNDFYLCEICDTIICKECYCEVNKEYKDQHECDPEMVETFKTIKKEAKPCPKCGEFISKIGGCDQMFCNHSGCGTAFSWKTGLIELGVIHNPHAHAFFQNNAEAQNNYLNIVNHNNNGCRPPIPNINLFSSLNNKIDITLIRNYHRRISEFRQYQRNRYLNYIQNNNDKNLDLRIRFINNELTDKRLKETLHARDKKSYFIKQIIQNIMSTYEISELILWAMVDCVPTYENNLKDIECETIEKINKNMSLLKELLTDTNKNIQKICDEFTYKNNYIIDQNFHITYISF